jgi:hypothetical protein
LGNQVRSGSSASRRITIFMLACTPYALSPSTIKVHDRIAIQGQTLTSIAKEHGELMEVRETCQQIDVTIVVDIGWHGVRDPLSYGL